MGLFNTLMTKIFGHAKPATQAGDATSSGSTASAPSSTSSSIPAGGGAGGGAQSAPAQQVDVAAILNGLAAKNPEKLDWKHSIVDLMKLVGMDSSLSARKELADDLGYTGDKSDSASMNIWLHKEVLLQLSKNGGKVPPELLNK